MSHQKVKLKMPETTMFSSDYHFFHQNIMKFCPRTRGHLKSREEMNEAIIKAHNEAVLPEFPFVFAGDFSFGKPQETEAVMRRLQGSQKIFVPGNHDPDWVLEMAAKYFDIITPYLEIMIGEIRIVICHYPIVEWNGMHHGSYHLFGHVHGKPLPNLGRSMDIGIDARPDNTLRPWTWADIQRKLQSQPVKEHGGIH